MDESQYEAYLLAIDQLDGRLGPMDPDRDVILIEQMRDGDGIRVPGCYRKMPLDTPE